MNPKSRKGSVELTEFDGKSTSAIGSIKLVVYAGGENKLMEFVVLNFPSTFNTDSVYESRPVDIPPVYSFPNLERGKGNQRESIDSAIVLPKQI